MAEFLVGGMLSGTGIRDAVNGGYVDAKTVGLSEALACDLAAWQKRYEDVHFARFPREDVITLDDDRKCLPLALGMSFRPRALATSQMGK